jgi:hypothetical protein
VVGSALHLAGQVMAIDLKGAVAKPANAQKFAGALLEGYLGAAVGARSKSEIDLLIFTCLIDAKAIDPDAPTYDLARALNIPRAEHVVWFSTGSSDHRRTRSGPTLAKSLHLSPIGNNRGLGTTGCFISVRLQHFTALNLRDLRDCSVSAGENPENS